MTTRTSLIAAIAVALAGTAGMAGWLALDPAEFGGPPQLAAISPAATTTTEPAVAETEAAVTPVAVEGQVPADVPAVVEEATPAARQSARATTAASAAARTTPAQASRTAVNRAVHEQPRAAATQPAHTPLLEAERAEPAVSIAPPDPPAPAFMELSVPASSILGIRLEDGVSSETAAIEDRVSASITRDVIVDGHIAIPAGTRLSGSVSEIARGGKFRETARLGVRFHTLIMDDGVRVPVRVDTIVREGSNPGRGTAAKIGGSAIGGAIIGGIMGGKKGAVLGGVAGAGAGTAVVATGDRSVAELVAGATLSLRLLAPVTLMIERR
jgi:hypothetical protein